MKANRKALGDANWWTKLTLGTSINEQDIIDKKQIVKIADKLVKKRKRTEKKLLNTAKHMPKLLKKKKIKTDQILKGFDIAKKWSEKDV